MVSHASLGAVQEHHLLQSLEKARERGFVGRDEELKSFAESLSGESEVRVHFVHGAGGIGKTSLLEAFARHAARAQHHPVYLDARDVECSAASVTAAVARRSVSGSEGGGAAVLLIDGYELLEPLDRWLREELLPSRPKGSVTVLAGRSPPPPGWRTDPGWHSLVRVHALSPFGQAHSEEMLARCGVPDDGRGAMAELAHGYPLVLSLLAEASHAGPVLLHLSDAPDMVGQLCRLIIDDIPDAAHRAGLATCAHATRMTEDLLGRIVGSRAGEIWAWLQSRPYVRRGAVGLFLHDVVRELFEAEFIQRSPDAYSALHRGIRNYFLERLLDPAEPHPERPAAEILLLHREGPLSEQVLCLRDGGLLPIVRAGPEDRTEIFELIKGGEGPESAQLARRWALTQPRSLYRVRSDEGIVGFAMQIYLPAEDNLAVDDPVAAAVMGVVNEAGPLRPGERVNINRFAGASGPYQRDPMMLLVNGVSCLLEWSKQPAAWTFIVTVDAHFYGPYFEYLGLSPMLQIDYYGQTLHGYGWDRRRFPVTSLFELMAQRELSGEVGPPPPQWLQAVPLAQAAFAAAVRSALTALRAPDRLADSPLLDSMLLDTSTPNRVAGLRAALQTGIEALGAEDRRVLARTYLKGATTQEATAELLGLPFSTYRRHLARAHEALIQLLWSVEIGNHRLADVAEPGGHQVGSK